MIAYRTLKRLGGHGYSADPSTDVRTPEYGRPVTELPDGTAVNLAVLRPRKTSPSSGADESCEARFGGSRAGPADCLVDDWRGTDRRYFVMPAWWCALMRATESTVG